MTDPLNLAPRTAAERHLEAEVRRLTTERDRYRDALQEIARRHDPASACPGLHIARRALDAT